MVSPCAELYQIKSVLPSPFKSALAVSTHLGSALRMELLKTAEPFISHVAVWPFTWLYQMRSEFPSPLRSEFVAKLFTMAGKSADSPGKRNAFATRMKPMKVKEVINNRLAMKNKSRSGVLYKFSLSRPSSICTMTQDRVLRFHKD